MTFGWNSDSDQYQAYKTVTEGTGGHKAHLSHELIAGAAAYEAAKAYEEHCKKNGKPANHAKAKEIFAGLAGVAITRLVETKGLDHIDKHKAQKAAHDHADSHIANQY